MKEILKYSFICFALALTACSKKQNGAGSNYSDDFKFYFNANINGSALEFKAGDDDYILNTSYSVEDSVLVMSGRLGATDSNFKNTVVFKLRGREALGSETDFNLEEGIHEGRVALTDASFNKKIPGEYDLRLLPNVVSSGISYFWTFEDGTTSTSTNPSIQVSEENHAVFKVSLSSDPLSGGCESKTVHTVNIESDCDATISLTKTHTLGIKAEVQSRLGQVRSVKWYRGNTFVGDDLIIDSLAFDSDGNYKVSADITFYDGCTKRIEKDLSVLSGSISFCDFDFAHTKTNVREYDPKQLGTIEMIYYDGTGKRFTSYYENNSGEFKIYSFRSFQRNELNQQTVRFLFEGDVTLKSEDGSSLAVTNAFGNFAVAHP